MQLSVYPPFSDRRPSSDPLWIPRMEGQNAKEEDFGRSVPLVEGDLGLEKMESR